MLVLDRAALLPERTAVVLLGGEAPEDPELLGLVRQAAFVAAADSGAAAALSAGRVPDLLVGDFDSLAETLVAECRAGGASIVELPVHKDVTDGEFLFSLMRQRAAEQGWRRLLVLGALGGRLDQTLANILCGVPLAKAGLEICLAGERELVLLAAALAEEQQHLQLRGFAGCVASLLALGGAVQRVELAGFAYPLAGKLAANITLGLSNVIEGPQADIRISGGVLLVCVNI